MISKKVQTTLDSNCIDFVRKSPLIFLGTSDASNGLSRGGEPGHTRCGLFDLFEIVPGFLLSTFAIVVVSRLTQEPTEAIKKALYQAA